MGRNLSRASSTWITQGMTSWQHGLSQWLQTWQWADDELCEDQKITWLELLIGFELDTRQATPDDLVNQTGHAAALQTRNGTGKVVHTFKTAALQLLDNHFTKDVHRLFYNATPWSPERGKRLLSLGVTGQWTVTNTWPFWPNTLWGQVDSAILEMRAAPHRGPLLHLGRLLLQPQHINK